MLNFLRRSVPYFPLCFVVFLLAIIAFYAWMANLSFTSDRIPYGLIVFYRATAINVVYAAGLTLFALMVGGVWIRKRLNGRQELAYSAALILSFVSLPFSCYATAFQFLEFGTDFSDVSQALYDNTLYKLAFMNNPARGKSSYNLYRCDSTGIECDRVYQLDTSEGTADEIFGDYQSAQSARLVADTNSHKISIIINDVDVFDYSP